MFRMMVGMVVSISEHLSLSNSKKVTKIVVNNDSRNSAHFREGRKRNLEQNTTSQSIPQRYFVAIEWTIWLVSIIGLIPKHPVFSIWQYEIFLP